jgi:DNA-binding MarR family transcriptional regulator
MSSTSRTKGSRQPRERDVGKPVRARGEVSSLEAHTGYWLRFVSNHVSHAFKVKVERHGVTVAEWVVMRALFARNDARPSELAQSVGLTRGAISKLVDRLARKDLVRCRIDPADRRAQIVMLSASGRRLVPRLAALADDNDAEMFGHLPPEQKALLLSVLRAIAEFHGLKGAPID